MREARAIRYLTEVAKFYVASSVSRAYLVLAATGWFSQLDVIALSLHVDRALLSYPFRLTICIRIVLIEMPRVRAYY